MVVVDLTQYHSYQRQYGEEKNGMAIRSVSSAMRTNQFITYVSQVCFDKVCMELCG
jgi:hypothetical protein